MKNKYQLEYNLYNGDVNTANVKTRNWIVMFCKQVDMPIIGHVLNKLENNKIQIEHWIQEIVDETISPLVQLPVIKKCRGCEIKTDQTRSKRNKLNTYCITNISAENTL